MNDIGPFIRLVRKKYGLTLRQMEAKCGLSNSYINQLENGRVNSEITLSMVRKLCTAFPLYEPDILLAFGIKGYFIEPQPSKAE